MAFLVSLLCPPFSSKIISVRKASTMTPSHFPKAATQTFFSSQSTNSANSPFLSFVLKTLDLRWWFLVVRTWSCSVVFRWSRPATDSHKFHEHLSQLDEASEMFGRIVKYLYFTHEATCWEEFPNKWEMRLRQFFLKWFHFCQCILELVFGMISWMSAKYMFKKTCIHFFFFYSSVILKN